MSWYNDICKKNKELGGKIGTCISLLFEYVQSYSVKCLQFVSTEL